MPIYLFATWSGGGNLPPAVAVATELVRRGDGVRVIGHDDQRAVARAVRVVPTTVYRSLVAAATIPMVNN